MANIFADIFGGVFGLAKSWLEGEQAKSKVKLEAEIKKIESQARIEEARATAMINLAANAQEHEQAWERIAVEQASHSWKDEFWTLLLAAPIVGAFVPGLQPYVLEGFANLDLVPEWYLMGVGIAIAFAFGYRNLVPLMKRTPKGK